MRPAASPLPPSSSLPRLRALGGLSEGQLSSALQGLSAIYCPLPVSLALVSNAHAKPRKTPRIAVTPLLDSGYVSGTEDGDEDLGGPIESLAILRADVFERTFVQRWLTGFVAQAEDLPALDQGDARQNTLDQAYLILESLFTNPAGDEDEDTESEGYTRNFSFDLRLPADETKTVPVEVQLNDHLAGTDSSDHEDVGLQSWGASIIFSQLICNTPVGFRLHQNCAWSRPTDIRAGCWHWSCQHGSLCNAAPSWHHRSHSRGDGLPPRGAGQPALQHRHEPPAHRRSRRADVPPRLGCADA